MGEDANDGADDDGVNTDGGTVTAAGGTQSTDPQPAVPVGVKLREHAHGDLPTRPRGR